MRWGKRFSGLVDLDRMVIDGRWLMVDVIDFVPISPFISILYIMFVCLFVKIV